MFFSYYFQSRLSLIYAEPMIYDVRIEAVALCTSTPTYVPVIVVSKHSYLCSCDSGRVNTPTYVPVIVVSKHSYLCSCDSGE